MFHKYCAPKHKKLLQYKYRVSQYLCICVIVRQHGVELRQARHLVRHHDRVARLAACLER